MIDHSLGYLLSRVAIDTCKMPLSSFTFIFEHPATMAKHTTSSNVDFLTFLLSIKKEDFQVTADRSYNGGFY